jgi:asparagine synthetase B (glutamine-hydrolysing)
LHGRFAIVYRTNADDSYRIVADATGMRAVFHGVNTPIAGSHAALVAANVGGLQHDQRPPRHYGLPGRMTPFEGVVLLVPNQELHISASVTHRIWPRFRVARRTTDEAVRMTHQLLRDALAGITSRYSTFLVSLTAGVDSRTTLALCLEAGISQRLRFFTYYRRGDGEVTSTDRDVAGRLAQRFSLNLDLIDLDELEAPTKSFLDLLRHNAYYRHGALTARAYVER